MRGCHAANQFTLFSKSERDASCATLLLVSRPFTAPRVSPDGGGDRIRTDDRLVANQVLYQLSYAPSSWWAWVDLNH